ncbi:hypothetical protein SDRG_00586 [Saprolegnia diclina VS20]|uniref:HECT-type E3 ubiquitin transferase n=1 Tax=Saprolegnia diclina (strain VS20) TaxID=1156394 RepID=T0SIQ9_SAPDV|nr:hypothetical protein SDRG_00586 [Saprolegnia diclina VS20]EQC42867.1 hypothetical protein SDRG_00586 [Saprolegnia diclina VS20]|eukprot:XP_008604290.1 hypothetical protein SDRG_00586 [Saprolegnia diclina VS20]
MFQRDADLKPGGKAALVEAARLKRDEREKRRAMEAHVVLLQSLARRWLSTRSTLATCRADLDRKLADVATLESVLQREIVLPGAALVPMLHAAFFILRAGAIAAQDVPRLLGLVQRAHSNWRLADKQWAAAFSDVPIELVRYLVLACLELAVYPSAAAALAFVDDLVGTSVPTRSAAQLALGAYLAQDRLLRPWAGRATNVAGLLRSVVLRSEVSTSLSSFYELVLFLMADLQDAPIPTLLIEVLTLPTLPETLPPSAIATLQSLWPRLLAAPVADAAALPPSPMPGLNSAMFLLANMLWLASSMNLEASMPAFVHWAWTMLQVVSDATYGGMAWVHVSASHSVPAPVPPAVTRHLEYLYSPKMIRAIVPRGFRVDVTKIATPLTTTPPTPMLPNAILNEEKFGFGNIAQQSGSSIWKRFWHRSKPQWATKLFGTSSRSKAPASSSAKANDHRAPTAFDSALFTSVAKLYGLFLFRWTQRDAKVPHTLLSALAFFKTRDGTSLVTTLWLFLQESLDLSAYAESTALEATSAGDATGNVLYLFVQCYNQLLVVLDDDEMYDRMYPLPLFEVERVVLFFKPMLFRAYDAPRRVDSFGDRLVAGATLLLQQLYNRCARTPFCNVTSWVLSNMDGSSVLERILKNEPQALQLIQHMPYLLMYADRVRLFEAWVRLDRAQHQAPDVPGFRINIRRGYILEDGLTKLNVIKRDLKKKIQVHFINAAGSEEVGIDAGGLFKEFWTDLSALAFDPNYGLFNVTRDQLLYPSPHSETVHQSDSLLFEFLGRILGKALYEGLVVQPRFARFFLTKLLGRPNLWHDLPSLDPELYKNLSFLKSYEGDVADLGLTFSMDQDCFGVAKHVELMPGGATMAVTSDNRLRYVHLMAHFYLNTQIQRQSGAFLRGLQDVIDVKWLHLFNEPELQVLISGTSQALDVADLKQAATFAGGYFGHEKRVQWLWKALESFSPADQARFLRFVTSCERAPILGFASLHPPFVVQRISIAKDDEKLPSAATCFNTLKLPTYSSYKVLREKLLVSINAGAGFEMT